MGNYVKPQIEVVNIELESSILAYSTQSVDLYGYAVDDSDK